MKKTMFIGISILTLMVITCGVRAEVIALWLFDEGNGNIAKDDTGNGNDGNIEKAKYVPGKYGTALKFEGEGFVNVGLPESLQNGIDQSFTSEVWIKLDQKQPSDHTTIIFMQVGGPIALGLSGSTGGALYGYAGGSSSIRDPDGPDRPPVGEWFHFAQTYDGEVQKLYFNGEEIISQNIAGAVTHTENPWTIGAWSTHAQYFLEATLDELRISDEALEPEELGFFNRFSPVEPQGKLCECWGEIKQER